MAGWSQGFSAFQFANDLGHETAVGNHGPKRRVPAIAGMKELRGLVRAMEEASDPHKRVPGPPEDADDRDLAHDFRRITAAAVGEPDRGKKPVPFPIAQGIRRNADTGGRLRPGKPPKNRL